MINLAWIVLLIIATSCSYKKGREDFAVKILEIQKANGIDIGEEQEDV
jgi:hypothetical protein